MRMKEDNEVDKYINESPDFAKPILKSLRNIIKKASPNVQETIKWNHPFYGLKELGLSFSKAHENVKLTFFDSSMINDKKQVLKDKHGNKKSMLFKKPSEIDEKTVTSYIKMALENERRKK